MSNPIQISPRSKKALISLALLGILLILFREEWLLFLGNFLVIQDTLHSADVIHVIAGEDYRTDYALQLFEQGYGKALFFSGGWCVYHNYYHGKHAEELSLSRGVPRDAIGFDDSTVNSTYMEAERLRDWISQTPSPIHSVIVVSDPFHIRRARWTYQRVLGDRIEVQMAPVPFELTPYQQSWWMDQRSRKYVQEEYQKYVYYIFRYKYSWGKFREWLASLDQG